MTIRKPPKPKGRPKTENNPRYFPFPGTKKRTPEYIAWSRFRQACYNPKAVGYKFNGKIGVTVCPRWSGRYGFLNFLEDMGQRPSKEYCLSRKDKRGAYSKENCVWRTWEECSKHSRSVKWTITARGKTQNVSEWSQETGLPRTTIIDRLKRGWDGERIISVERREMHNLDFKPGRRFGSWTVVKEAKKKHRRRHYLCRCDCGRLVVVNGSNLLSGLSHQCRSCGCRNKTMQRKTT